ncbi:hypothetical protein [Nocardia sp. NPDC051570]|uniref:hypothetical protein n=1 Tax=Nocardia sp. NPDC051570 TaxID=3364324 RepID=UPI003791A3DB
MNLPQYPGGYDPYPRAWQPAPSGGTAIAAGVLAAVGAVGELLGGLFDVVLGATGFARDLDTGGVSLLSRSWYGPYIVVVGVLSMAIGVVLTWGAIALFRRGSGGRPLIAIGAGLAIAIALVGAVVSIADDALDSGPGAVGGVAGILVGMAFPIATMVLVLTPATARWLAFAPATGPAYPMPPYPPAPYPPQSPSSQPYPGPPPAPHSYPPPPPAIPPENPWRRPES